MDNEMQDAIDIEYLRFYGMAGSDGKYAREFDDTVDEPKRTAILNGMASALTGGSIKDAQVFAEVLGPSHMQAADKVGGDETLREGYNPETKQYTSDGLLKIMRDITRQEQMYASGKIVFENGNALRSVGLPDNQNDIDKLSLADLENSAKAIEGFWKSHSPMSALDRYLGDSRLRMYDVNGQRQWKGADYARGRVLSLTVDEFKGTELGKVYADSGYPQNNEGLAKWLVDTQDEGVLEFRQRPQLKPDDKQDMAANAEGWDSAAVANATDSESNYSDYLRGRFDEQTGKYVLEVGAGGLTESRYLAAMSDIDKVTRATEMFSGIALRDAMRRNPRAAQYVNMAYEMTHIAGTPRADWDAGTLAVNNPLGIDDRTRLGSRNPHFGLFYIERKIAEDYANAKTDEERKEVLDAADVATSIMQRMDLRRGQLGPDIMSGIVNIAQGGAEKVVGAMKWIAKKSTSPFSDPDEKKFEDAMSRILGSDDRDAMRFMNMVHARIEAAGNAPIYSAGTVTGSTAELFLDLYLYNLAGGIVGKSVSALSRSASVLTADAAGIANAAGRIRQAEQLMKLSDTAAMFADVARGGSAYADIAKTVEALPEKGRLLAAMKPIVSVLENAPIAINSYDTTVDEQTRLLIANSNGKLTDEEVATLKKYVRGGSAVEGMLMLGLLSHLGSVSSAGKVLDAYKKEVEFLNKFYYRKGATLAEQRAILSYIWNSAVNGVGKEGAGHFMFGSAMEIPTAIFNAADVERQRMEDPDYIPTPWDYRGGFFQDAVKAGFTLAAQLTGKSVATRAVSASRGAKETSRALREKAISSRPEALTLSVENAVVDSMSEGAKVGETAEQAGVSMPEGFKKSEDSWKSEALVISQKLCGDMVKAVREGDAEKEREIYDAVRAQFGVDVADRLSDVAHEYHNAMGGEARTFDMAVKTALAEGFVKAGKDAASMQKAFEEMGLGVKVADSGDGGFIVTIPKDMTGAAEDTVVPLRFGDLTVTPDADGRYAPNWAAEIVERAEAGDQVGEFNDAWAAFKSDKNTTPEMIAKVKDGENINGLLDLAADAAFNRGVFNSADGSIVVNTAYGTEETLAHETIHALLDAAKPNMSTRQRDAYDKKYGADPMTGAKRNADEAFIDEALTKFRAARTIEFLGEEAKSLGEFVAKALGVDAAGNKVEPSSNADYIDAHGNRYSVSTADAPAETMSYMVGGIVGARNADKRYADKYDEFVREIRRAPWSELTREQKLDMRKRFGMEVGEDGAVKIEFGTPEFALGKAVEKAVAADADGSRKAEIGTVSDILDMNAEGSKELLKWYPKTGDIKVVIDEESLTQSDGSVASGQMSTSIDGEPVMTLGMRNLLALASPDTRAIDRAESLMSIKDTVVHELQHYIQGVENFAKGSDMPTVERLRARVVELEKAAESARRNKVVAGKKALEYRDKGDKANFRVWARMMNNFANAQKRIESNLAAHRRYADAGDASSFGAYMTYWNSIGEREARASSRRSLEMSAAERGRTLLEDTMAQERALSREERAKEAESGTKLPMPDATSSTRSLSLAMQNNLFWQVSGLHAVEVLEELGRQNGLSKATTEEARKAINAIVNEALNRVVAVRRDGKTKYKYGEAKDGKTALPFKGKVKVKGDEESDGEDTSILGMSREVAANYILQMMGENAKIPLIADPTDPSKDVYAYVRLGADGAKRIVWDGPAPKVPTTQKGLEKLIQAAAGKDGLTVRDFLGDDPILTHDDALMNVKVVFGDADSLLKMGGIFPPRDAKANTKKGAKGTPAAQRMMVGVAYPEGDVNGSPVIVIDTKADLLKSHGQTLQKDFGTAVASAIAYIESKAGNGWEGNVNATASKLNFFLSEKPKGRGGADAPYSTFVPRTGEDQTREAVAKAIGEWTREGVGKVVSESLKKFVADFNEQRKGQRNANLDPIDEREALETAWRKTGEMLRYGSIERMFAGDMESRASAATMGTGDAESAVGAYDKATAGIENMLFVRGWNSILSSEKNSQQVARFFTNYVADKLQNSAHWDKADRFLRKYFEDEFNNAEADKILERFASGRWSLESAGIDKDTGDISYLGSRMFSNEFLREARNRVIAAEEQAKERKSASAKKLQAQYQTSDKDAELIRRFAHEAKIELAREMANFMNSITAEGASVADEGSVNVQGGRIDKEKSKDESAAKQESSQAKEKFHAIFGAADKFLADHGIPVTQANSFALVAEAFGIDPSRFVASGSVETEAVEKRLFSTGGIPSTGKPELLNKSLYKYITTMGEMRKVAAHNYDRAASNYSRFTKEVELRKARGFTAAEMDRLLGAGSVDIIDAIDLTGKKANLTPSAFASGMERRFVNEFKKRHKDLSKLSRADLLSNRVYAKEYAKTMANWIRSAAKKYSFSRTREVIMNMARDLDTNIDRADTVKGVVETAVEALAKSREKVKVNDIIDDGIKRINKEAMGRSPVVENKVAADRKVAPWAQTFMKHVKDVVGKTEEAVYKEIDAICDKWGIDKEDVGDLADSMRGREDMSGEAMSERFSDMQRLIALSRYGALRSKTIGEAHDAMVELNSMIDGMTKWIEEVVEPRNAADREARKTLTDALKEANIRKHGEDIDVNTSKKHRAGKFFDNVLYFSTVDLFARLEMEFSRGTAAHELCERFRRDMSIGHITQEKMIGSYGIDLANFLSALYSDHPLLKGKSMNAILTELTMPRAELAKFSRSGWTIPKDGNCPKKDVVVGTYKDKDGNIKEKVRTIDCAVPYGDVRHDNPTAKLRPEGLSLMQLAQIYASVIQPDMRLHAEAWGYDGAVLSEIEDALEAGGMKGLNIVQFIRDRYELIRNAVSPVCEKLTGLPVRTSELYNPLRFQNDKPPTGASERFGTNAFPSFLRFRKHDYKMWLDENADLLSVYNQRIQDSAHYVAFGEIIDRAKTTFQDKTVHTAWAQVIGNSSADMMYRQMAEALCGGRRDCGNWIEALQRFVSAATLSYRLPTSMKQLSGFGTWAAPMGVAHWLKNAPMCFMPRTSADFELAQKEAGINLFGMSDMTVRGQEGFSTLAYELMRARSRGERRSAFTKLYDAYTKHGMDLTQLFDWLACRSMAGAYFNQRYADLLAVGVSRNAAKAEAERVTLEEIKRIARRDALADVDSAIQPTQQSSRYEFRHEFQRGGSASRMFGQFAGPKFLQLGMEIEAAHRLWMEAENTWRTAKGTKERADAQRRLVEAGKVYARKWTALHVFAPALLNTINLLTGLVFHDPDDRRWADRVVRDFAVSLVLGPWGNAWLLGSFGKNIVNEALPGSKRQKRSMWNTGDSVPITSKAASTLNASWKGLQAVLNLPAYFDEDERAESLQAILDAVEAYLPVVKDLEHAAYNVTGESKHGTPNELDDTLERVGAAVTTVGGVIE